MNDLDSGWSGFAGKPGCGAIPNCSVDTFPGSAAFPANAGSIKMKPDQQARSRSGGRLEIGRLLLRGQEGFMVRCRWLAALVLIVLALNQPAACAQGTSGPRVSDSPVGYIDSAIPGNTFRLRFDSAFDDVRGTRAEFFYAKGGPLGPGLPVPEPSVDFQELHAYLEVAACERLSAFINLPVRFLQTERNGDHAGFSDLDAGFKYAFLFQPDRVATFQFRTYVPTGDADLGLGTRHVSLEPALLLYDRLTDRFGLAGELRVWVPVGGTDFAGDIVRYGIGVYYDLYRTAHCTFTPVAEFVGWTVLDGKESVVPPSGVAFVEDAAGQTILNAKVGLRVRFGDRADFYTGYGQPLTGNRWYENTFRLEFRLFF
jgi:hypothetical protein